VAFAGRRISVLAGTATNARSDSCFTLPGAPSLSLRFLQRQGGDFDLLAASRRYFSVSPCNQHSPLPTASLERRCSPLSLRPRLFVPIFRHSCKAIQPSHLPPANYSFKVVFRDFRVFHSAPVKALLCSSWNIQLDVPVGTFRVATASAVGRAQSAPLRYASADRRWYKPWQSSRSGR
jgi:hypothetical protein